MEEIAAANQEGEFNDLVNDITRSISEKLEPPLTSECCIYRVPSKIREVNEKAYTPRVVSIGPFHNGDSRLKAMENLKLRYLERFLLRSQNGLKYYIGFLKDKEADVRRCYAETIQHSSDSFVKMILLDSCFIIELFLRIGFKNWTEEDRVVFKPWLRIDITLDLLLLENQLPFFVLEDLFNVTFGSNPHNQKLQYSFTELTLKFFQKVNLLDKHGTFPVKHFTDLLRMLYLPDIELPNREDLEGIFHLPSASEFREAGLKFKVTKNKKECLLNLKYANGVLEIPCFAAEDLTELLFRNILALEQCHYPEEHYILDYFFLLDFLLNTTKDVEILVGKGILINWLGDNEALAIMVNSLGKNLTQHDFNSKYWRICRDLKAFYDKGWHRRKATLRHDYFNTPWKTASSIAAILLLFLTLIQSVCSVIALF